MQMLCDLWDAGIAGESPYDPNNETIRKDG